MKQFFFAALLIAGISAASLSHAVTISLSLPATGGTNPCSTPTAQGCNPTSYINNFYTFTLLIGGLVAFGAIVFGGVKYMTSAGNPSSQSEGKAWIESALLGLLLLAGAYLILNTVNPNLTQLNLPTLQPLQTGPAGGASSNW